jgi:hypothetical protein
MLNRTLAFSLASLALVLLAATSVPAGDKTAPGDRHDGTVVSVTAEKLVMKGKAKDGEAAKEHTHMLAENAKVTCDGKACKLQDLKAGQKIRVTTKSGDRTVAMRVEALLKNEQFEKSDGNRENRSIDR